MSKAERLYYFWQKKEDKYSRAAVLFLKKFQKESGIAGRLYCICMHTDPPSADAPRVKGVEPVFGFKKV